MTYIPSRTSADVRTAAAIAEKHGLSTEVRDAIAESLVEARKQGREAWTAEARLDPGGTLNASVYFSRAELRLAYNPASIVDARLASIREQLMVMVEEARK